MPADSSIFARQIVPEDRPLMKTLSDVSKTATDIAEDQNKRDTIERNRQQQAAMENAFRLSQGNSDTAASMLEKDGWGEAAAKIRATAIKQRADMADAVIKEVKQHKDQLDSSLNFMQGVRSEADFQARYPRLRLLDPDAADQMLKAMGGKFNQELFDQFMEIGLNAKDSLERKNAGIELLNSGKLDKGFLRYLSAASDADEYARILSEAPKWGVPAPILATIPKEYSPANVAKLLAQSMDPKEREDLRMKKLNEDRVARNESARIDIARQNLNLAREREKRVASGAGGAGGSDVATRQALTWRANQLMNLERRRDTAAQMGEDMDEEEYQAEIQNIEDLFQTMPGAQGVTIPTRQTPSKFKTDLKQKELTPEEAATATTKASNAGSDITLTRAEAGPGAAAAPTLMGRTMTTEVAPKPKQPVVNMSTPKGAETARQRAADILKANNYPTTPDAIETFLKDPENRKKLAIVR